MVNLAFEAKLVALDYPCFPTDNKKPCWSNKELGVAKGQGGYKIATQNIARVEELFSHPGATEIAVPMGEASGLICVDVDIHKADDIPGLQEWYDENFELLKCTRRHKTRSGGWHFIFKHPGGRPEFKGIHFPATLREGVDLKAAGNGYICFPPTEGYTVDHGDAPLDFPIELLRDALKAKGGSGAIGTAASNSLSNEELVAQIHDATSFHPALLSLSYRMCGRRNRNGRSMEPDDVEAHLNQLMDESVAAEPSHSRHGDWLDRRAKIPDLVSSAINKLNKPLLSDEELAAMTAGGPSLFEDGDLKTLCYAGPRNNTLLDNIKLEIDRLEQDGGNDEFVVTCMGQLRKEIIKPVSWLIPNAIPSGKVGSIAGSSNVGKTRLIAHLAVSLTAGKTELMGLEPCEKATPVVWIANEEDVEEIKRRAKAAMLHYDLHEQGKPLIIRGSDVGALQLVIKNIAGNPEINPLAVAKISEITVRHGAGLVILDPYVTLSAAIDENDAASAAILTEAFKAIATLTGAAVLHVHHTVKTSGAGRKEYDSYRADRDAWRGSGAIYSGLDFGMTLANWMPQHKPTREAWKKKFFDNNLSRWIVLDTGKAKNGARIEPVVYEMTDQKMQNGEGRPVGICRLSSQDQAEMTLIKAEGKDMAKHMLAAALADAFGIGEFTGLGQIHEKVKGQPIWPDVETPKYQGSVKAAVDSLGEPIAAGNGLLVQFRKTRGKWVLHVWEKDDVDG